MPWTATQDAPGRGRAAAGSIRAVAAARRRPRRADRRADRARGGHDAARARIERVAGGLAARGFGPGDVLALWAPNEPRWAGVALAAMAAGGAVTGIHPGRAPAEVARQLEDAGARVLVCAPAQLRRRRRARRRARRWSCSATATVRRRSPRCSATAPRAVADRAGRPRAAALLERDDRRCRSRSMLTHAQLVAAASRQVGIAASALDRARRRARAPALRARHGLRRSRSARRCSPARPSSPCRASTSARCSRGRRATASPSLAVPPPVWPRCSRAIPRVDGHDLSSLELIVSGGAPLGAGAQRAARRPLPARRGRPGLRADGDRGGGERARPAAPGPRPARRAADGGHGSCASSTRRAATSGPARPASCGSAGRR